jgi:hypothetical protein
VTTRTARTAAHWLVVAGILIAWPASASIIIGAVRSEHLPVAFGIALTWIALILFATALRLVVWPHTDLREGRCQHCKNGGRERKTVTT